MRRSIEAAEQPGKCSPQLGGDLGGELGVSVQILTHSLSHSAAWIARLIAPKRLQFLQRLATGRVRPIGGHVCRDKLDDE